MDPFVSITRREGKAVVQVRVGAEGAHFPLTQAGCLAAGRHIYKLFDGKVDHWLNSSSVDFPQEYRPGCRLDVRGLMSEGFEQERTDVNAPRETFIQKMVAFCIASDEFVAALSQQEADWLEELRSKIRQSPDFDHEEE